MDFRFSLEVSPDARIGYVFDTILVPVVDANRKFQLRPLLMLPPR
jgi:hypothetical protein